MVAGPPSASRGKSDTTLQRFAIETLPRQGLITDYNGSQLVVRRQHSENRRPIHSGTMRYNPLLRNRKVIIGCRTFHDLLMSPLLIQEYLAHRTGEFGQGLHPPYDG